MKSINYKKNIALVTVATFVASSLVIGAHADESVVGLNARTVQYADLNLNTQAGSETLYSRIHSAAEHVCGDVHSRQINEAAVAKACVRKAISDSIGTVNNARLTNTYNAHFGVAQTISVASAR